MSVMVKSTALLLPTSPPYFHFLVITSDAF